MSEVKNNEVIEETTEVTETIEEEAKVGKLRSGIRKHGKKIAIAVGAAVVGFIGYKLIKRGKSSGCDCDLEGLDVIDVDYVECETIE